jgi:predicted alpha/beta-fold hydrolase
MALSPLFQFLVYLVYENFCQIFFPTKFVREEFDLEDGGIMAIDWAIEKDGTSHPVTGNDGKLTKPLLLLFAGLGGGNNNLYTLNLVYKA